VGVILACLLNYNENETKCERRDISETSYRQWFAMQYFEKYAINYGVSSNVETATAVRMSEASYLYNEVHVHCVVFVKKTKNAVAIKNTWAKRCNEVVFFGVKNTSVISLNVLKPKSSWEYLCHAIRHLWQSNKADLHWALFVPDDVFVIPENLRYYVASLDYREPHYLGDDVTFWGEVYNIGDAGYVLSKGVIYALQMKFNSSELCHKSGKYWRNEDFYLGNYICQKVQKEVQNLLMTKCGSNLYQILTPHFSTTGLLVTFTSSIIPNIFISNLVFVHPSQQNLIYLFLTEDENFLSPA